MIHIPLLCATLDVVIVQLLLFVVVLQLLVGDLVVILLAHTVFNQTNLVFFRDQLVLQSCVLRLQGFQLQVQLLDFQVLDLELLAVIGQFLLKVVILLLQLSDFRSHLLVGPPFALSVPRHRNLAMRLQLVLLLLTQRVQYSARFIALLQFALELIDSFEQLSDVGALLFVVLI